MSKRAEEAALKAIPNHPSKVIEKLNIQRRRFFSLGYEQAEKDTIERACNWLFSHLPIIVDYYDEDIHEHADRSEFIKSFRIQMEKE